MYIPSTQGSPLARETAVTGHCPLGEYKDLIESNPVRPKMQQAACTMSGVVGVQSQFLHTHNYIESTTLKGRKASCTAIPLAAVGNSPVNVAIYAMEWCMDCGLFKV